MKDKLDLDCYSSTPLVGKEESGEHDHDIDHIEM